MKILITGASGLIGGRLAEYLNKKKLNFSNDKNFIKEIDNLILYCKTNF